MEIRWLSKIVRSLFPIATTVEPSPIPSICGTGEGNKTDLDDSVAMLGLDCIPEAPPIVNYKRVVIERSDGNIGILGVSDTQPTSLLVLPGVDGPVGFSLVRVTPRAYYYREIVIPITGRLGEFHPSQV